MSTSAASAQRISFLADPCSHIQTIPMRLEVERRPLPSSPNRRLQDLHARVIESLVNSGYVALGRIGCDIDQNRVILHGSVPSYHLKQLAQVYQRVEGIGRIENRLEVRGRGPY